MISLIAYFSAGCGGTRLYSRTGEAEAGKSAWSIQGIPGRLYSENIVLTGKWKKKKIKKD